MENCSEMHLSRTPPQVKYDSFHAYLVMWFTQIKHRYLFWQLTHRFEPAMDLGEKRLRLRNALTLLSEVNGPCHTGAEEMWVADPHINRILPTQSTLNRQAVPHYTSNSPAHTVWRTLMKGLATLRLRKPPVQKGSQIRLFA